MRSIVIATELKGKRMKFPLTLIPTPLLLFLPGVVQAACDRYFNLENSVTFPATISVPDSLPVGALITRQAFSGPFPNIVINCYSPTLSVVKGRYSAPAQPYQTNVPGIGVAYRTLYFSGQNFHSQLHSTSGIVTATRYSSSVSAAWLEFYKTGPVVGGTFPSGTLTDSTFDGNRMRHIWLTNPIRFVNPSTTCDLAVGDVNRTINLQPIKVSDLKDSVFAGVQPFDLTANCNNAGVVNFRFTGTPATGNVALFANTGTARGVDLWLYSRVNGVPETVSNNSTRAVAVSGNRAVIPLSAGYHKNGTVSQGSLASVVTVNITYN